MNDLVQLYELPLWTSAISVIGTVGLMLGGPVGATLMDHLGSRPTFGIETCTMAITILILYFTLRLPQEKDKRPPHAAGRLEYPSAALLLLSVATPLFAINLGGEMFPWHHPLVITLLCLTPAFVTLFYYVDTRVAATPIVPKRFLRNKHVAVALACTLPMKFVFDQLRFSFGTYLEARTFHSENSFSDWALTCIYLGRPLGTIGSGILVRRYRKYKRFLQLNIIADIVLYACFAWGKIQPEKPAFAPLLVFIGATEGSSEGLWLVALLSLVEPEDQPLLYAFYDLALCIAGDLGIAISLATESSLVRSRLHTKLSGYNNAAEVIRKSLEDLTYVQQLPPRLQTIILDVLISSTEVAFGISCAVLAISLVASLYVKEMSRSPSIMS
ncbi:hypothetical protein LTR85_007099 [Meristemomyces frigidus]|nr:hypothetical protein LTR85_007099 [Meristemomyces frigidus]